MLSNSSWFCAGRTYFNPTMRKKATGMKIPLARPDITDLERKYVLGVLGTPSLSLGPKLQEFEKKMTDYVGTKYAIAVSSGTSGLHLIVRAMGIGEADEVVTTPFSFVASANCILFERAKPVFVDIDSKTLNINVNQIKDAMTKRTKAILAVDIFGHPTEWDELRELAKHYNLRLIEDSAEALGAEYKSRKAGSLGDTGVFGFYPNKQITTGEGGMIVTDDETLAKLCRSMRNQGRSEGSDWLEHERLGYNYRLSDINCALGIAQLERINQILAKREKVANMYNKRLKEVDGIEIPYASSEVKVSWFVYVVRLRSSYSRVDRDRILEGLRERGIGCRAYFSPIHLQLFYREMFGYKEGDFPTAESVSERTIALPFYGDLGEKEVNCVVENLRRLLREPNRYSSKICILES